MRNVCHLKEQTLFLGWMFVVELFYDLIWENEGSGGVSFWLIEVGLRRGNDKCALLENGSICNSEDNVTW